ncbi:MAG: hypothetical protein ACYTEP_11770 [Planctomycetota bacterium]
MRTPRLRVLLPVALFLTVTAPLLRQLPGGGQLPDVWLLLLLLSVPVPAPDSWRRPAQLVFFLGFLRSRVTAISPFSAWAGFGMGLLVRDALSRRLSEYNPLLRLVTGFCAAVPLAVMDRLAAQNLGADLDPRDALLRCLYIGLVLAIFHRPQGRRFLSSRRSR